MQKTCPREGAPKPPKTGIWGPSHHCLGVFGWADGVARPGYEVLDRHTFLLLLANVGRTVQCSTFSVAVAVLYSLSGCNATKKHAYTQDFVLFS